MFNINNMKRSPAFTLIELLVVLGTIGLLLLISLFALNVARQRSRDYKRIADVERLRANLELYYNNNSSYPLVPTAITLGESETSCLNNAGFQPVGCEDFIMPNVPADPKGSAYQYVSSDGSSYVIRAQLERELNGLYGVIEAYPSAIVNVGP